MLPQSGGQMAGARFLKHNIRDDFDDLTDVARLYGVRAVPCFVFFIGGAQVCDIRREVMIEDIFHACYYTPLYSGILDHTRWSLVCI